MKTNEHTLSIQQMQTLRLLGIDTTDAHWVKLHYDDEGNTILWYCLSDDEQSFKIYDEIEEIAYTLIVDAENGNYDHSYRNSNGVYDLQNIMQLMPELYPTINAENKRVLDTIEHPDSGDTYLPNLYLYDGEWRCGYISFDCGEEEIAFSADNPLDAAFEMLCWLGRERCIQLGIG